MGILTESSQLVLCYFKPEQEPMLLQQYPYKSCHFFKNSVLLEGYLFTGSH